MGPQAERPEAGDPVVRSAPIAPPPPEETYRPLSGLALLGFGLAALYAVIVFGGGLISFLGRIPWLLPGWTIVIALGGLFVSWVARGQIREAEGTLSDASLAAWGLTLSFTTALLYHAYLAATYFAVKHQATEFAQRWVDTIKKGELDKAFLLTVPAPRPATEDAPDLRATLENLYNAPGAMFTPGEYTGFCQSEYVRLLAQGGQESHAELLGVRDWGFKGGGYQVVLLYRVDSPTVGTQMQVTLLGTESPVGEYAGRQWHVVRKETGLPTEAPKEFTDAGRDFLRSADEAHNVARTWLSLLSGPDRTAAYLDTLPPAARPLAEKAIAVESAAAAAGPAALAMIPPIGRDYPTGFRAFAAGGMVNDDPAIFHASRTLRPILIEEVKRAFDPAAAPSEAPSLVKTSYPIWEQVNDRTRFRFPVMFRTPAYSIEGDLLVSAPTAELNDRRSKRSWQVETLQLMRGRALAKDQTKGGR